MFIYWFELQPLVQEYVMTRAKEREKKKTGSVWRRRKTGGSLHQDSVAKEKCVSKIQSERPTMVWCDL